ncbi:MAG TPA: ATP-binding cassette domain-containing protein [Anaerolineaceae bacterium]|nr:ATP-binding cassette domain-containing protein [Longilinea sp.]HNR45738.1 ATP-binding cassette domain-containing protein [Anaerolineaceae bacterium]HNS36630.1 ATP-binding cassette domain-containing protein [Anaerolineaceae bacterium]HNZ12714.1 ATP-binding cassette domain-containing protein [Anaerolineaceae bacterium]HOD03819.1 ATP-binding cassette domain-containing protein [Anaerolineaceae bacterium]
MNVELRNIHKHFGKVHANNDITLNIPAGVIQGILGENGAGKSTLMKVLSGYIHADSGEILLDGQPVRITSPADAIRCGVGMLHQDPLDFPPMRIIDNFILGQPGGLLPNRRQAEREFHELRTRFDFNINPDAYVDSLTVGERQQLEILRLLWLGARVLILDEPTTGISAAQKTKLFATLRILAEQGKTAIFVSHKLEDVEELCHRVAVLQRGRLVGEAAPPYVTDDLVRMMFGKGIKLADRAALSSGKCGLSVTDLSIEDVRLNLRHISLEVNCGEVIGLAGMEGSGQRQFLRVCGGLQRPVGGHLHLNGHDLTGKPYRNFLDAGVAYVPASRLEEGLIPGLTLTEHFILTGKQPGFFINRAAAQKRTEQGIEDFSIRGTPASQVERLSGGNQQRALLALQRSPLNLLLLEHPTRGLDIESSIWIWGKLKERCRQGTSIIFISADLDEILHYSDRVLVFFGGRVSEPLDAASTSVDQLGQLIGGKGF